MANDQEGINPNSTGVATGGPVDYRVPSAAPAITGNIFYVPAPSGGDDTATINAVKASASAGMATFGWQGALVRFQPGIYKTSSMLTWPKGISCYGAGAIGTTIRPTAPMAAVFQLNAGNNRIKDFLFQPSATQQAATTLAVQLTALATITQITVATVPAGGYATGALLTIGPPGGGTSQTATVTGGPYAAGGSNVVITVTSFVAYYTYAVGAAVQDLRFSPSAVAADGIQLTNGAQNIFLEDLDFYYLNGWAVNYVPTGGITAFVVHLSNLYANHCAHGYHFTGSTTTSSVATVGNNVVADTMDVDDAFFIDGGAVGCHDVQLTNIWGGGLGNCVHIKNDAAAIYITNFDLGGIPGYLHQAVLIENPAAGSKPRQIAFDDGILQASLNAITISDGLGITFGNTDIVKSAAHGVVITGGDSIELDGLSFEQNNQSQAAAQAEISVTGANTRVHVLSPRFRSTLVASAMIVPASPNKVTVVDPLVAGPPALYGANVAQVTDNNYGGAGTQGKTIQTNGAQAGLVLNDQGGNGPGLQLIGSSSNMFQRLSGSALQWVSAGYAAVIGSLSNAGTFGVAGGIQPGTPALAAQTGNVFMGSGVPSNANGNNGDVYFRTDTPGTANQRMYMKSAGSWVALTL